MMMTNHISAAVDAIKSEVRRLQGVLSTLENGSMTRVVPAARITIPEIQKPPKATTKSGKRRKRRSTADVQAQADAMVTFIKARGKDGATTKQIVKQFGKTRPSIKAFIGSKVNAKIKTSGAGRSTVYTVD